MKHKLLGVVSAVVVYAAVSRLLGPPGFFAWRELTQEAYVWALAALWASAYFVSTLVGAVVSRGRFALAAFALWAASNIFALQVGYRIQQVAIPMELTTYLSNQLPALPLTLAGALLGAWTGAMLSKPRGR